MKAKRTSLILIGALTVFLSACKDDLVGPGSTTYTITGHLYKDCSMEPAANKQIDLFQEYGTGLDFQLHGGILGVITTDANGYFKFEFKDMNGGEEKIRMPAGEGYNDLMIGIPPEKSHSNLVVFLNPSVNVNLNLNVMNSYTSNDTLTITDFRDIRHKLKIPGPFTSGLLYSAENFPLFVTYFGEYGHGTDVGYQINNGTPVVKHFKMNVCGTNEVVMDIN